MALDLVVGEAVDLHQLPDLLRRRHCIRMTLICTSQIIYFELSWLDNEI